MLNGFCPIEQKIFIFHKILGKITFIWWIWPIKWFLDQKMQINRFPIKISVCIILLIPIRPIHVVQFSSSGTFFSILFKTRQLAASLCSTPCNTFEWFMHWTNVYLLNCMQRFIYTFFYFVERKSNWEKNQTTIISSNRVSLHL